MSDDIVARLRESDGGYFMRRMFAEAADEIERLRRRLLAEENAYDIERRQNEHLQTDRNNLELEVERLRKERDKAIAEIKRLRQENAKDEGWDCFKEDTDER
jgi:septal ring factor EnvC (AmiA/AmiB activator)